MIASFLAALVSFTRFPVARTLQPEDFQKAVWHLPLLVWMMLLLQAGLHAILPWPEGTPLHTLLLMAVPILCTGALHEDGLADFYDAIGASSDRQRRLDIMKDPRVGTYGVLALILVLGLQWSALQALEPGALLKTLAIAQLGSRLIVLGLISQLDYYHRAQSRASAYLPHPGFGGGFYYAGAISLVSLIALPDWNSRIMFLAAGIGLCQVWVWYLKKSFAGYTGDCLGAAIKVCELLLVLLASCVWPR